MKLLPRNLSKRSYPCVGNIISLRRIQIPRKVCSFRRAKSPLGVRSVTKTAWWCESMRKKLLEKEYWGFSWADFIYVCWSLHQYFFSFSEHFHLGYAQCLSNVSDRFSFFSQLQNGLLLSHRQFACLYGLFSLTRSAVFTGETQC